MTILASKYSENEIYSLSKIYKNIVKNKDGQFNLSEFIVGLKENMVEISNIDKETLLNLDTEKSGQISYNGFYIMLEYVAATISKDKYSF